MSLSPPFLQIAGLHFSHGPIPVFQDFQATLPPGLSLVCGDEGRGKTTLLRLLAGELKPDAGSLRLGLLDPLQDAAAWQAEVCWLDPKNERFDRERPADCFAWVAKRHPRFDRSRLDALLEGLGLVPHLDKALYMLSTGTRRKVWLAAALASQARLVLLDEPFAALDRSSIRCLETELAELVQAPDRAGLIADYGAPPSLPLAAVLDLGD